MNRIMLFEDHEDERAEIFKLINQVIPVDQFICDTHESIRDFDATTINSREAISAIITDILHSVKDLSGYHDLLDRAKNCKTKKDKRLMIAKANSILIDAAVQNMFHIAKIWIEIKSHIFIITKINHPNFVSILEKVSNDNSIQELFSHKISDLIAEINQNPTDMYECGNIFVFFKKEFYIKNKEKSKYESSQKSKFLSESEEVEVNFPYQQTTSDFDKWFVLHLAKILGITLEEGD
ncbi:hypothetical protein AGMMS50212_01930 [Spirochaetia bacterium]|nr:hypothetical protein AGMMS50212_01930 [Spirochaetia bacterium]